MLCAPPFSLLILLFVKIREKILGDFAYITKYWQKIGKFAKKVQFFGVFVKINKVREVDM